MKNSRVLVAEWSFEEDGCNRSREIDALNESIRNDSNLGKGFEIGHSYFCAGLEGELSESQWFEDIIDQEIGPQLREFWFDDQAKAEEEIEKLKQR